MHAVTQERFDPPEVLVWSELPDPVPGAGEVVIAVRASGVNRADLLQRAGDYPPPPGASSVLGLECSGRIVDIGPDVEGWRVGDDVCALLAGGGYAELVAVAATQLLPIPAGVSVTHAGGLPEAACTVWSTVFGGAGLHAGETLLVHGGTSGIGTFAIQLAHALGVRVFTTAGTPAKCARALALGAEVAIDYRLDGRLVVIGTQNGRRAELDLGLLMAKRATVFSAGLRARPPEQKAAIVAAVRANVWPVVETGAVTVVVDTELPMPRAAEAHRIVEGGDHVGKVLLTLPATITL